MDKDVIEEVTENNDTTEICTDNTEELLEKYDNRSKKKADDIPAMQTAVCIITIVFIFGINILYPEIGGGIFNKLNEMVFSENEIFPNPIDLITGLI